MLEVLGIWAFIDGDFLQFVFILIGMPIDTRMKYFN